MPLTWEKPQSPYAAMMDEMSWARRKAPKSAADGRSVKNHPCERVMKICARGESAAGATGGSQARRTSACEIWATWR